MVLRGDIMAENIYKKIMDLRCEFASMDIIKTGKNNFQNFQYLELHDFVPQAIKLCHKYELYTHVDIGLTFEDEIRYAVMTVVNIENPDEHLQYRLNIPVLPQENNTTKTIQSIGKLETYCRRYLYMLLLDLAVPDTVDSENNNKRTTKKPTFRELQQRKKAQKKEEAPKDYEEQVVEPIHRPRNDANNDMQIEDPEPLRTMCNQIIQQLKKEGKEISKSNMRVKAFEAKKKERITEDTFNKLRDYINNHCPKEGAK